MRILRTYVLKELASPFIFAVLALLFLFMAGRGIIQMADLVINKGVNLLLVIELLLFSAPFLLIFVIPMAMLLAALLAFGKLSHDNEIMAMQASGVGLSRILAPVLTAVIVLCLATFLICDRVTPAMHYAYRQLLTRVGIENPAAALEEGVFIKKFKNFIIFIYEIDKNKLKGIRIYQPQEGKPTRTIIAQKGELVGDPETNTVKLKLIQGTSDEPDPKDPAKIYKLNFKTYDLPLNLSDVVKKDGPLDKKPKDMSITELKAEIAHLGEAGIKASYSLSAEIHNKIAISFASLAFVLIAIPLAITRRRSEKSVGFAVSLLVISAYWFFMLGGKALAEKGLIHPFIGLQFSNLLIGSAGIVLLTRLVKH